MSDLVRLVVANPRRIIAGSVLLLVAIGTYGAGILSELSPYSQPRELQASAPSAQAAARVATASGVSLDETIVALVSLPGRVDDSAGRQRVDEVVRVLQADPAVAVVRADAPGLLSTDGRTAAILAAFRPLGARENHEAALALQERLRELPGVTSGGEALHVAEGTAIIERRLPIVEALTMPVLFLLSFWFFRGLVAALLPPLLGGLAVVGTLGVLRALGEVMPISVFALNLVTALALGLSLDYGLFLISRFREELARGVDVSAALRRTLETAGRTVLFSALTVAAALASLLVFPQPFLRSMAVGGILVAALACALALLVLPALLALLGRRVDALAPARLQRTAAREARPLSSGVWYRLSHAVLRRPLAVALAAGAFLLLLAAPVMQLRLVGVDAEGLPPGTESLRVEQALQQEFAPPLVGAAHLVGPPAEVTQAAALASNLTDVAAVGPLVKLDAQTAVVDVVARDAAGERLVAELRALPVEGVVVGGRDARLVDERAGLVEYGRWSIGIGGFATLVLVFLLTGSLLLAVKTIVMNVLTVLAAIGVVQLVFGDVIAPVLVFVAALAFGLSTDYGVFVLSRMREAWDSGLPNREAVAVGLERSGRLVTAAALLLVVALGALGAVPVRTIEQTAVGLVAAVAVDAFVVRSLLVPSLMGLLGRWNWWAPAPLARLHAALGVGESKAPGVPDAPLPALPQPG